VTVLILASASPRRRELLERVGFELEIQPANVDESPLGREEPGAYARRLAVAKAEAIHGPDTSRWVLAADTIVSVDGDLLGKAADAEEARAMLHRVIGRSHKVTTGFAIRGPGAAAFERSVHSTVVMREVETSELTAYLDAGEWQGKAGAYAIQGMAAAFVSEVNGSFDNVVGLPLAQVVEALSSLAGPAPDYRRGVPA
jgi:septum formation protein